MSFVYYIYIEFVILVNLVKLDDFFCGFDLFSIYRVLYLQI